MPKEEQELISFLTLLRRYDTLVRQQINNQILDWNELSRVKRTLLTSLDSLSVEEVVNYILVNGSREKIIQLTRSFDAIYNDLTDLCNARSVEIEANSSLESFCRAHELFELEIKATTGKFTEVRKKKEALERSLDSYFYGGDDASRIKAELEIDRIEPIFQAKLRENEAKIIESKQFFDNNFQLTKSIIEEVNNALTVRIKPLFDIFRESPKKEGVYEYFPMSLLGNVYEVLKGYKVIEVDALTFYLVLNLNEGADFEISPNSVLYYLVDSLSKHLADNIKDQWFNGIYISFNIDRKSYDSHYKDIHNSQKWKKLYKRLEQLLNLSNKE